jgi:hypothetical protein
VATQILAKLDPREEARDITRSAGVAPDAQQP